MNDTYSRKSIKSEFPGPKCAKEIEEILSGSLASGGIWSQINNFYSQFEQNAVIPDASYTVSQYHIENPGKNLGFGEPGGASKYLVYCRADGQAIVAAPYSVGNTQHSRMLDVNAPKPMVFSYRKFYWPAINLGWGLTKGCPGYMVVNYDANNFQLGLNRITDDNVEGNELVDFPSEYDYTHAIALEPDYTRLPKSRQNIWSWLGSYIFGK